MISKGDYYRIKNFFIGLFFFVFPRSSSLLEDMYFSLLHFVADEKIHLSMPEFWPSHDFEYQTYNEIVRQY